MRKVLKYGAILAFVAVAVANFPDVKRYIRICLM
jgi:hypothetical protein